MSTKNVPDWLVGVWRRRSIQEDGLYDSTTQVFWLQTHSCFGDIRIPADRPNLSTKSSSDLTSLEAIALSKQRGFAGITEFNNVSTCQWHRYIDYQPFSGKRDIGSLHWEGDTLIEFGVEEAYKEEWQRLDDGNGDVTALTLLDNTDPTASNPLSWQGCLVTVGNYFVYARKRSRPLPNADSLTTLLIDSAPDKNKQLDYLNCEISYGVCKSSRTPWEIQLSTLPWREGYSLWSLSDLTIDLEKGQVLQTISNPAAQQVLSWTIQEWGTGFVFE